MCFSILLSIISSLTLLLSVAHAQPKLLNERGQVLEKHAAHGSYFRYVPNSYTSDSRLLVLVHGSIATDKTARFHAEEFIRRWLTAAEQQRVVLIAPAFDRRNYQSYGGYRGLFGRLVGADEFLHELVREFESEHGEAETRRFLLYGHSAGGQFVIRYLVRHPQRVLAAVASAPGRYAFPDTEAPWPYGMGRLRRIISYERPREDIPVHVVPEREGWITATEVPLTILVGSRDLEPQPHRPGHRGRTRIDLARNWKRAMDLLARKHGRTSHIRLQIIGGLGHNSRPLTPYAIEAMF